MLTQLFQYQMALCNVHLLLMRVAWNLNQLHPVEQRGRNRAHRIRRRDEKNLRQVERYVQVAEVRSKKNRCGHFTPNAWSVQVPSAWSHADSSVVQ